MARGVDEHQLVVAAEVVGERPPAPAGLGEAVQQHEPVGAGRGRRSRRGGGRGAPVTDRSVGPAPAPTRRLRPCPSPDRRDLAGAGTGDLNATFCATFVDEWVRAGVTDAVVCPGSRSTPMALALADDERIRVHVHHDERSGAFMALGLGRATVALRWC